MRSRSASPRSRRSSNSDLNGITASIEREDKNGQYTTNSNPSNQSKSGPNGCVDGDQGSKTQQPVVAKFSSAANSFTWHSKTFEEEQKRLQANVSNVRETRSRAARSSSETRLTKGSREHAGDIRMPNSQQRKGDAGESINTQSKPANDQPKNVAANKNNPKPQNVDNQNFKIPENCRTKNNRNYTKTVQNDNTSCKNFLIGTLNLCGLKWDLCTLTFMISYASMMCFVLLKPN